jgi:hypothetical protein
VVTIDANGAAIPENKVLEFIELPFKPFHKATALEPVIELKLANRLESYFIIHSSFTP